MNNIQAILKKCQIENYLIHTIEEETTELFFIKKALDTRRMKKIKKYQITVYRDFMEADKQMRGSATIDLYESMNEEEMAETLKDAYYAASFVKNPYYPLLEGKEEAMITLPTNLKDHSLEESARLMTEALYQSDNNEKAWINSAELFVTKQVIHILSSAGSKVGYTAYHVAGEFITQCQIPQDVEKYNDFYFDTLNTSALSKQVKEALETTIARANAQVATPAGKYNVILSGPAVQTLLEYYVTNSNVSLVYPKHSSFKVGDAVQGQKITGDALKMTLHAEVPYTAEGLPKTDHVLLENGVLKTLHGEHRLAHYLNVPSIGKFNGIQVAAGSLSFNQMLTGNYLHIVSFSDFQMDTITGHFGGEIRLAFYQKGNQVIPVTGGALSANIKECQTNMYLSQEMQVLKHYEGPKAICFKDIQIG